jgi:saccharopine dehydrogenase-like NADP-dependent oxidoreductase
VLLVPRWIDCRKVTFKYGLGDEFIEVLKTLHKLGLDSTEKVVALELLASGEWAGAGVLGPEAFPAQPFLAKLEKYGSPHGVLELAADEKEAK